MKKTLLGIVVVLTTLLITVIILTFALAPPLPPEADEIIEEVLSKELPELVTGDTGLAQSGDVKIWYESIKPSVKSKGTILIIMGIGGDALEWPAYFYQPLVDSGYQVILYDNRGTGLSDWGGDTPYTLENMADDAVAVLDKLGVEKAEVFGMSMGGMIAQTLAIRHPGRVRTLTSVMSSGYMKDTSLAPVRKSAIAEFIALALKYGIFRSEKSIARLNICIRKKLSPDGLSLLRMKTLAESTLYKVRYHNKHSIPAIKDHRAAILASGSRYAQLKRLTLPTLIIHGKSDPLIPIEHGKKCAALIPHSRTLWVEKMGHDIAPEHTQQIHKALLDLIKLRN